MLCADSAIPGVKIGTAFPMANFAVWGLAIASSLFLAPSVIFFNVGFRCSRLFNTKKDILDRSYCGKVDEELSRILVGSGFVFLVFAICTACLTLHVCADSWRTKREDIRSMKNSATFAVWPDFRKTCDDFFLIIERLFLIKLNYQIKYHIKIMLQYGKLIEACILYSLVCTKRSSKHEQY